MSMDADWLNRAGILAEAVAFVLVAPEILGASRLRTVERVVEVQLDRLRPHLAWWGDNEEIPTDWDVYFITAFPIPLWAVGYIVARLMSDNLVVQLTFVGLILLNASGLFLTWIHTQLIAFESGSASALVTMAHDLFDRIDSSKVFEVLFLTSTMPAMLVLVPFGGMVSFANRLLAGPDRLRALVFSAGVLLLLGGMAAQFVATF